MLRKRLVAYALHFYCMLMYNYMYNERMFMAKSATLDKTMPMTVRVNPEAKAGAEAVLSKLGLSTSTAVDMFLRQINRTKKVPLKLEIDDYGCPDSVNVAKMTPEELWNSIKESYDQAMRGEVIDFDDFDREFRSKHGISQNL